MESLNLLAFMDDFRAEAAEHLRILDAQLVAMEREPSNLQFVRTMFLSAHTIKGGASILGLDDVRGLAHAMEDVLDELRGERRALDGETADLLFHAVDRLRELIGRSKPGQSEPDPSTLRLVSTLRCAVQATSNRLPNVSPGGLADLRPRILVVDDSATVRYLAAAQLSSGGFDVDTASDGRDALAKAATRPYDLVVAAIETRGLRGPDLARAIRAVPGYRDVPIILMTSDSDPGLRQGKNEFGVAAYVRKGSFSEHGLLDAARAFLTNPAPDRRSTEQKERLVPTAPRRILVVDDSDFIRTIVKVSLQKAAGWEVVEARSGGEALPQAIATAPDAILMDMEMPDMDGPAAIRTLRADGITRNIPVIFLTARDELADDLTIAALGAVALIAKPIDPVTLASQVGRLLGWK